MNSSSINSSGTISCLMVVGLVVVVVAVLLVEPHLK